MTSAGATGDDDKTGDAESGRIESKLAHDLANLLTAMMANARVMRRNAGDKPRIEELATTVEDQARRALDMIQGAARL
ncbi:MAG: hypothetical protein HY678_05000 [Chloroflexi bacterium]|nr:hypothetical protein [Chloroflexota bacterium]